MTCPAREALPKFPVLAEKLENSAVGRCGPHGTRGTYPKRRWGIMIERGPAQGGAGVTQRGLAMWVGIVHKEVLHRGPASTITGYKKTHSGAVQDGGWWLERFNAITPNIRRAMYCSPPRASVTSSKWALVRQGSVQQQRQPIYFLPICIRVGAQIQYHSDHENKNCTPVSAIGRKKLKS